VEILSARRAAEQGYTTANIRVSWRESSYRLTIDALNLANAVWLDASGRPAPSRSVFVGAAIPGRL